MGKICTFVGHSSIAQTQKLETELLTAIESAISKGIDEFYCGGYGDFDLFCANTLRALKNKYPFIKIFFITPYINEGYQSRLSSIKEFGLCDEIIYPELEDVPYKFAISKRNEYMIDCAEIVIAYVMCEYGGAYTALKYAKRRHKNIIMLDN